MVINISDCYNDPKYLDRLVRANSVDPDQTGPGSLIKVTSASFGCIALW